MSTVAAPHTPAPAWERNVDVLVIGSGAAGLSVALGVAGARSVLVVSSGALDAGSTSWAQGGIAAAVRDDDSPAGHAADTAAAAAGLADAAALDVLVEEGPGGVADLVRAGAAFDRDREGSLDLAREGGHTLSRVVHAGGDATGREVARTLVRSATAAGSGVEVLTDARALDLLRVERPDGSPQVTGALVATPEGVGAVHARAVVLATGGLGHAYAATTNPPAVRGEGIALALRAGAEVVDLEFVQFHPTVLHHGLAGGRGQRPLVTEALRGEGAVLLDPSGRALMTGVHPMADLAPRDVVARTIATAIESRPAGLPAHVWLDTARLGRAHLQRRFPTLVDACAAIEVDPAREPVPVSPGEHFSCGGVRTDTWGRSSVPGLFAVGEVAATGVHGANRLASNGVLEGLVFGRRIATRLVLQLPEPVRGTPAAEGGAPGLVVDPPQAAGIPALLERDAGILRDGPGLARGLAQLASMTATTGGPQASSAGWAPTWAAGTLHAVAVALFTAAAMRQESRGCHTRRDFPTSSPAWERRVVLKLAPGGRLTTRTVDLRAGQRSTRRSEVAA